MIQGLLTRDGIICYGQSLGLHPVLHAEILPQELPNYRPCCRNVGTLSVESSTREPRPLCEKYNIQCSGLFGLWFAIGFLERVRLCTLKGAIDNIVRSYKRHIHGFKSELGISATGGLSGMHDMNLAASSAFVGRVLLVSDDAIAVEELSESMQRFALSVEHCTEVSSALEQLKRSKFEAVIVDFQIGSKAGTVLQETRQSASN